MQVKTCGFLRILFIIFFVVVELFPAVSSCLLLCQSRTLWGFLLLLDGYYL